MSAKRNKLQRIQKQGAQSILFSSECFTIYRVILELYIVSERERESLLIVICSPSTSYNQRSFRMGHN